MKNNNNTPNYVLQNNYKPATHFVELYKITSTAWEQTSIQNIYNLDFNCKMTSEMKMKTIALFKIRLK